MSGAKIIEGLKQAIAGDLARVTIDGRVWVRLDLVESTRAADAAEIVRLMNEVERQQGIIENMREIRATHD